MNPLRQEKLNQLKLELACAQEQILELEQFSDNCFTAANYNDHSISKLEEISLMKADASDCKKWGISENEWLHSVQLALETKLQELRIKNIEDELAVLED